MWDFLEPENLSFKEKCCVLCKSTEFTKFSNLNNKLFFNKFGKHLCRKCIHSWAMSIRKQTGYVCPELMPEKKLLDFTAEWLTSKLEQATKKGNKRNWMRRAING